MMRMKMNLTMNDNDFKFKNGKFYAFIYIRTNKLTKQSYVGQTNDMVNRNYHFMSLKCDYAGKKLEKARRIYGTSNTVWNLRVIKVEADTVESLQNKLDIKECAMMHKYDSVENGYNTYYKKFKRKVKQQTSVTTIALAA